MNQEAEREVAEHSRLLAQKYFEEGNYGRSFAHLLVVLKLVPALKNELKSFFSTTLSFWGRVLEEQGRYGDLFSCYHQAIQIFPENELVLNNLGLHLFRLRHFEEAKKYFEGSLRLNGDFLPALRNLTNVLNFLIERWHYRMLNDSTRNEAYRSAIQKKIQQGFDSVLDIGTGTGLLSLFALEGNAKHIYACDYSGSMIKIAQEVVKANFDPSRIKLISKISNDIKIPEDIPSRVSLVFTETMDCGLLGEHILLSISHAWEELLLPQNSDRSLGNLRVVPHAASLFVAPVECLHIARKNKIVGAERSEGSDLGRVSGLDLSRLEVNRIKEEPYDTEDLRRIPGGFKLLAEPREVFRFDFNDPIGLKKYVHESRAVVEKLRFDSTESGYFDALVVWFRLDLDDEITLSSSPLLEDNKDCCWDQGVFPSDDPYRVEKGSAVGVEVECKGGKLSVRFGSADKKKTRRQEKPCVTEKFIRYLNNRTLLKALVDVKDYVYSWKSENLNVLDLSPFPFVCLTLNKMSPFKFTWLGKTESEVKSVSQICKTNRLSVDHSSCLLIEEFSNWIARNPDTRYDVIFLDLFETSGEINEITLQNLPVLQTLLKPNGFFSPTSFTVWCQLVDSEWIASCLEVRNPSLDQRFDLSRFINEYKVYHFPDLPLDPSAFVELSDKFPVATVALEQMSSSETSSFGGETVATRSGRLNSVVYWFEYELLSGERVSTWREDSHTSQAAQLLHTEARLQQGTRVRVRLLYDNGFLRFNTDLPPDSSRSPPSTHSTF